MKPNDIARVILHRQPDDLVLSTHSSGHLIHLPKARRRWHEERKEVHFHKREIHMVLEGEEICWLNGKTYRNRPGTIFLVDKGDEHDTNQVLEKNGVFFYLILYDKNPVWFDITVSNRQCIMTPWTFSAIPAELIDLVRNAWQELNHTKGIQQKLCLKRLQTGLNLLFYEVAKSFLSGNYGISNSNAKPQTAVQETLDAINENLGRDISVKTLAKQAGYSQAHFQTLFKQQVGCTIHQYVDQVRKDYVHINCRTKLLKNIADDLGFRSLSAFSHWCRKKNVVLVERSNSQKDGTVIW